MYASHSLLHGFLRFLRLARLLRRFHLLDRLARFQRLAGEPRELGTVPIGAEEGIPHDRSAGSAPSALAFLGRSALAFLRWTSHAFLGRSAGAAWRPEGEWSAAAEVFLHLFQLLL